MAFWKGKSSSKTSIFGGFHVNFPGCTLPETNSSPLKIGRAPKGNNRIPTIHFSGAMWNFRGVSFPLILWTGHQSFWYCQSLKPVATSSTRASSRCDVTAMGTGGGNPKGIWPHQSLYHYILNLGHQDMVVETPFWKIFELGIFS